jgi:LmbE family N-acetylglucosaminyl deacetylase
MNVQWNPPAFRDQDIDSSVLVVAHPDDEALWFSAILGRVGKVILGYSEIASLPKFSRRRQSALKALPLVHTKSMNLREAEAFGAADWQFPQPNQTGLILNQTEGLMPGFSSSRYVENFNTLQFRLRTELADKRFVFTHSPWGEYGHEEHVQVFRVVESLRAELGFRMFFTMYVSAKSMALFRRYLPMLNWPALELATDRELAGRVKAVYQANNCWTWTSDYEWPEVEYYVEWTGEGRGLLPGKIMPCHLVGFNWKDN